MGIVDSLFLLHIGCFGCALAMAIILVFSRLQTKWINKRYERARWLLFASMIILAVYFLFQLKYSFYSISELVGGTFSILIYVPVAIVIFYSMFSLQCSQDTSLKYLEQGFGTYALIVMAFGMGCWMNGSIYIGWMLYVMVGIFLVFVLYLCVNPLKEIYSRKKLFESVSGSDILPYNRYIKASFLLMAGASIMLAVSIANTTLLLIVVPILMICLIFYTINFVALGFNVIPSDELIDDYGVSTVARRIQSSEKNIGVFSFLKMNSLSIDRVKDIKSRLDIWCSSGGFRDRAVDMITLSNSIDVPRSELSIYFEKYLCRSFRTWLSDVRFNEAQRILMENPEFNNERISSECGFSSHAHLYKIFKARTNMSPKQWKESQ